MKKILITMFLLIAVPSLIFAAERLMVKDNDDNEVFVVQDTGVVTVDSFDGTGKVQVFENAIPDNPNAGQIMFELVRAGGVRFDLVDQFTGSTWVFQNRINQFSVSLAGTGVQEMFLEGNGNLTIQGTLFENSDVNSDSRSGSESSASVKSNTNRLPRRSPSSVSVSSLRVCLSEARRLSSVVFSAVLVSGKMFESLEAIESFDSLATPGAVVWFENSGSRPAVELSPVSSAVAALR